MLYRYSMQSLIAAIAISSATGACLQDAHAQTYRAKLTAVNSEKIGSAPAGEAILKVVGDKLEVHIKMHAVPVNIEHWEHFHGFPDARVAKCITPDLDSNKDGFLDLLETEPASGTTMVPFNDKPEEMVIPTHTYPHAGPKGDFDYTKMVPLAALADKFASVYKGQSIDLDRRVIYVHGVPSDSALPGSVGSLGPVPSHVTLPIACGTIEKISD